MLRWLGRAMLSVVLGLAAVSASAHEHVAYSHDDNVKTNNPDWMASLPDDVKLSWLSLPGTHDSLSLHWGDIVETQSMGLEEQLRSGIRVLDVRCQHSQNHCRVVHGVMPMGLRMDEVLDVLTRFLAAHPRETVLMRVKKEGTDDECNRTFEQTWQWYRNTHSNLIWRPTSTAPTLSDVRGKVVVLVDFAVPNKSQYGLDYNSLNAQDDYKLTTNWDLYGKWQKVHTHFVAANTDASKTIWYINYLSGASGSFPYFVASGHSSPGTGAPRLSTGLFTPVSDAYPDFPRVDCVVGVCTIAFEGTNILSYERDWPSGGAGIVMADFPGPGLIKRTIDRNDPFKGAATLLLIGHVQDIGDMGCWSEQWCGTRGSSLRLEALAIKALRGTPAGMTISYRCSFEGRFTTWVSNGERCGTTGQGRSMKGIEIQLDYGSVRAGWHILYQGHIQDVGDTAIVRDGAYLGNVRQNLRLEAIKVWLQPPNVD